jgi:hypothetical protein
MKNNEEGRLIPVLPDPVIVKVVGLGGVGSILLPYLALYLRSTGNSVRLVLVDGDTFDPTTNTKRMFFNEVGNKAEVKARELRQMLGDCNITVIPIPEYLTDENKDRLLGERNVIFLAVDNHPTRKLVSNHIQQLRDVVLISGGNEGVDPPRERGTYGNAQIYVRREGQDLTVTIEKYHPEIKNPKGKMPTEMDCVELAFSQPQILFTNMAVASTMLSMFYTFLCGELEHQEVKFDILEARMLPQLPLKEKIGMVLEKHETV